MNTRPASTDSSETSVAPESIEALRRVHHLKREITARKIGEALERMVNGTTIVLKPGYKLNKKCLAKEAGIDVTTLQRKEPGGAHVYATLLNKLASHKASGKRTPQVEKDKLLIASLRKQLGDALADRDKSLAANAALVQRVIEAEERERETNADRKLLMDQRRNQQ